MTILNDLLGKKAALTIEDYKAMSDIDIMHAIHGLSGQMGFYGRC